MFMTQMQTKHLEYKHMYAHKDKYILANNFEEVVEVNQLRAQLFLIFTGRPSLSQLDNVSPMIMMMAIYMMIFKLKR